MRRGLTCLNRGDRLPVHNVLDTVSKSPRLVRVRPHLTEVDVVNRVERRGEKSYVLHIAVNDLLLIIIPYLIYLFQFFIDLCFLGDLGEIVFVKEDCVASIFPSIVF